MIFEDTWEMLVSTDDKLTVSSEIGMEYKHITKKNTVWTHIPFVHLCNSTHQSTDYIDCISWNFGSNHKQKYHFSRQGFFGGVFAIIVFPIRSLTRVKLQKIINASVPQEPTLFLLYINDLPTNILSLYKYLSRWFNNLYLWDPVKNVELDQMRDLLPGCGCRSFWSAHM